LVALLLLISVTPAVAATNIGSISDFKGPSEIVRKTQKFTTQSNLGIEQLDNVQTGNGRVEITFVDNSKVKITEHSKLVIDDFVYTGNPNTSKMALKFASGTVRFATGQTGTINKQNINLKTPVATIAVRGTDFTSTVDDFGKTLVILLPEDDGTIGEITVSNGGGSVIMNKAFQATIITTSDTSPTKPVILKLDINMIDNMMIISPPKEDTSQNDISDSKANILDLSELDIDYLKNTELETDNLPSTLDVLAIDSNFLQDYLSSQDSFSNTKDGVSVQGTSFGYDAKTQIYTLLQESTVSFVRSVDTVVNITVERDKGKNINIDSNNKSFNIQLNEGGGSISVKQKN